MTGAIRFYSRAAIAQKDLQENMTIHIRGPISGRISVVRLAGAAALAAGLASMPAISFSQTCPAPGAQPTATTTTVQDRDQMLCQLHVTLPTLPPRAQDPHAPPGSFPLNPTQPDGNWTDNTVPVGIELLGDSGPITPAVGGDTVQRSDFGLWNGYIDQAGIGAPNIGGINPGYKPIDLLRTDDGRRIYTPREWWLLRRPEILHETQVELYGIRSDAKLPKMTGWTETDSTGVGTSANIAYKERDIVGNIDISSYPQVRNVPQIIAYTRTPASATGPVPMIIIISPFGGFGAFLDKIFLEEYWGIIAPSGYGVTIFDTAYLQPDSGGGNLSSYFVGLITKGGWRTPTTMGELGVISWGVSRLIDYFETDPDVDATKVGLSGHSRWGKATLVAAAYEPRLAIALPSCGGSLGTKMQRRMFGQTMENSEWDQEYHWMAGNFMSFMGPLHPNDPDPVRAFALRKYANLKVDAHSMVALVAPRPIFLNGGTIQPISDTWQDAQGMFLATEAATPVYNLLGEDGVIIPKGTVFTSGEGEAPAVPDAYVDSFGRSVSAHAGTPPIDVAFTDGNIGWRRHREGHTDIPDWPAFLTMASRYFSDKAPVIASGQQFKFGWMLEKIGKVEATGHDLQNWQVVGGSAAAYFDVDSRTGELRYSPDLLLLTDQRFHHEHWGDYEATLLVTVSDGINTSQPVTVKISLPDFF
jgi:hypothetical protein